MQRQSACKCGIKGYSTRRNNSTSNALTCKTCESEEEKASGNRSFIQDQGPSRVKPSSELSISLPQGEQGTTDKEKSPSISNPLQKRRSKPSQNSRWNRFANQLRRGGVCQKAKGEFANRSRSLLGQKPTKYDDDLIYEKSKLVSHDEIGLGAVQLIECTKPELVQVQTIPDDDDDDDDASSSLFDVPISGPSK